MIQLQPDISQGSFIDQLKVNLELNGYKCDINTNVIEETTINLSDIDCKIFLNFNLRNCKVECSQSMGHLKKLSEIIKNVLMLI